MPEEPKMAKVVLDSQTIEVDEETAKDDETLRALLRTASPDAANGTFTRETKDGILTVKIIKRAGTKGASSIITALLLVQEQVNPAVLMQQRLIALESADALTHLQALTLRPEIEQAVADGQAEIQAVKYARGVLSTAQSQASKHVPLGF